MEHIRTVAGRRRRSQHAMSQQRGEQRMTDYDPRTDTGIPTEPVGSLPRPEKLAAGLRDYDAGNISKDDLEKLAGRGVQGLDRAWRGDGSPIISDGEQRWSSFATYPIADTLGGHGPCAEPRAGRAVLRDLRRRPRPPAAQARGRPAEVQLLCGGHAGEVVAVCDQADEAGGDRAVDARAAVPAEGSGRGLLARGVRGGHRPGVRDRHPQGLRGRCRPRVDRFHRGSLGDA